LEHGPIKHKSNFRNRRCLICRIGG
jgi:hypothetical protein